MVSDVIRETLRVGGNRLSVADDVLSATVQLRSFLWQRVYENDAVHREFFKATKILKDLYQHFVEHPDDFLRLLEKETLYDTLERCICDFLAGMTDRYAFSLYEKVFLPLPWGIL
jgi:dGTPase